MEMESERFFSPISLCYLSGTEGQSANPCAALTHTISPPLPVQEMVLELGSRRRLLSGCWDAPSHFLFEILQKRLKDGKAGSALGEQLWRQQELLLQRR